MPMKSPLKVVCWKRPSYNILLVAVLLAVTGCAPGDIHIVVSAIHFPSAFASMACCGPGVPASIMVFMAVAESTGIHLSDAAFESAIVESVFASSILSPVVPASVQENKTDAVQNTRIKRFIIYFLRC